MAAFCNPIEPPLIAGDWESPWRFARFDSCGSSFKARSMPTSEHYRKSAQECRRIAKETDNRIERETLLRMAAQWDRLADHKARLESKKREGSAGPVDPSFPLLIQINDLFDY